MDKHPQSIYDFSSFRLIYCCYEKYTVITYTRVPVYVCVCIYICTAYEIRFSIDKRLFSLCFQGIDQLHNNLRVIQEIAIYLYIFHDTT